MAEWRIAQGTVTNKFTENGQPVVKVDVTEYIVYKEDWDKVQIGDRVELFESDEYGGIRMRVKSAYVEPEPEPITSGIVQDKSVNTQFFPFSYWVKVNNEWYEVNCMQYLFISVGDEIDLPTDNTNRIPKQEIKGLMLSKVNRTMGLVKCVKQINLTECEIEIKQPLYPFHKRIRTSKPNTCNILKPGDWIVINPDGNWDKWEKTLTFSR